MKAFTSSKPRAAFSLLELMLTVTLMALVVTTVTMVLRSSQEVWLGHQGDQAKLEAAHAVLSHLRRQLRQTTGITAISTASNPSGTISADMPSGSNYTWALSDDEVTYGISPAADLIAAGISTLSFTAYEMDAVTPTETVGDIQCVVCTVTVELSRDTGGSKSFSTWVWLRSW